MKTYVYLPTTSGPYINWMLDLFTCDPGFRISPLPLMNNGHFLDKKTPMTSSSRLPDMRETLEGGTPSQLHVWAPVSPLWELPPSVRSRV